MGLERGGLQGDVLFDQSPPNSHREGSVRALSDIPNGRYKLEGIRIRGHRIRKKTNVLLRDLKIRFLRRIEHYCWIAVQGELVNTCLAQYIRTDIEEHRGIHILDMPTDGLTVPCLTK